MDIKASEAAGSHKHQQVSLPEHMLLALQHCHVQPTPTTSRMLRSCQTCAPGGMACKMTNSKQSHVSGWAALGRIMMMSVTHGQGSSQCCWLRLGGLLAALCSLGTGKHEQHCAQHTGLQSCTASLAVVLVMWPPLPSRVDSSASWQCPGPLLLWMPAVDACGGGGGPAAAAAGSSTRKQLMHATA